MRPIGKLKQLAARRTRALTLLKEGKRPSEIARIMGVTTRSIRYWKAAASQPTGKRKPRSRAVGRPRGLSDKQVDRLRAKLLKGAFAQGHADDYWTLDRIAHLIWDLFRVRYTPSGVWHILDRMDWSCQKVRRVAIKRDDDAIAHWIRYTWPQIKKTK
jgi:transposase